MEVASLAGGAAASGACGTGVCDAIAVGSVGFAAEGGGPDDDCDPDSPQIVSTIAAAAAAALPTNVAARVHPIDLLGASLDGTGTLVSPQRLLRISCIHGRSSRPLSGAC